MTDFNARIWLVILCGGVFASALGAETPVAKPAAAVRIEPGLENAIRWKWWVVPSDEKDWGIKPPEPVAIPTAPTSAPGASLPTAAEPRPAIYEVQRGDALIKIAKKFSLTVEQLKNFNGKKDDVIRIGEVMKIPTVEDLKKMAPPPPPVAIPVPETPQPEKKAPVAKGAKGSKGTPKQVARIEQSPEFKSVLMQVFLDREQFSTGPVDGKDGTNFAKMVALYQMTHGGIAMDALAEKAHVAVGEPFTRYVLGPEDFKFILPPVLSKEPPAKKVKTKPGATPAAPPISYEELVAEPFLAYRSPWEFVAERFHCDEAFLRRINYQLKPLPGPGSEFKVPNVIPFEVEKVFKGPLQPPADPTITAAVVDLSRLEIYKSGALVAAMPMSMARPDLRGRGSWTVLNAIPRPRLATRQEVKESTRKLNPVLPSATAPAPPPTPVEPVVPKPMLETEQYLAPGPNNPVGVVWINLAKAKSTEPLPYGLHGTAIPDRMGSQESLGGLRLTNWDAMRAVRLLPPGTPLQWR